MREFHQSVTGLSCTVDDLFAEGDKVAMRWSYTGTHSGHFRQHAPTNQPLDVEGVFIFRFEGEKVAEVWLYYDGLDFDLSPK